MVDQAVPSKWSTCWMPRTQTSFRPRTATLWMNWPSSAGTRAQAVPSKCHNPSEAPIQTSFGPLPDTVDPVTPGTTDQVAPFQCSTVPKPTAYKSSGALAHKALISPEPTSSASVML